MERSVDRINPRSKVILSFAMHKRNSTIDFAKYVLICFVIWGHTIQALCSPTMKWSDNEFIVFICTFQMPLFILISGFFLHESTEKQSYFTIAKKKTLGVLVPILFWSIILYAIESTISLSFGWTSISDVFSDFCFDFINRLWYLWAYWFISIIMCVINGTLKSEGARLCGYLFVIVVTHCGLGGEWHIDFMFPFFLIGYYIARYKTTMEKGKVRKTAFVISTVLFPLFLHLYKPEYSMYFLESSFDVNEAGFYLWAYFIRFMAGVTGCVFIYGCITLLWKAINRYRNVSILTTIGTKTMELYILQTFVIQFLLRQFIGGIDGYQYFHDRMTITNFLISPFVVITVLALCLFLVNLLRKVPVLSQFVFGVKKVKR